jgi:WD40 repeat protein/tRNA A-37 threonylcarbamoyl transferase component Bud32
MLAGLAAAVPSWPAAWRMQSAGGDVHSSEGDKTIDGVEPPPVEEARPVVPPVIPGDDYPELAQVERHHYVISGEIAKGGMGRVFEARDRRLGRQVAIKELLPRNRDAARRFEREARITARLQHPAIIHVYEAGCWPGGEPFYAMPKVPGRSLDKVVAERATVADRLALLPNVIAVADALAYAHSQNVIHRDLKPANVLVGEFGETVVIDWGLAKDLGAVSDPRESLALRLRESPEDTISGSVVGTPAYMPPEQARGDAIDQRVDVYAIGALLYKVLAGVAPYQGNRGKDILEHVKAGPPAAISERAPGAPRDLVAIVEKAMAREPAARYVTAGELAQDLKRFQTGQLVAAHRYTRSQLLRRFVGRHRVAITVGALSVAAIAAVGTVSIQRIIAETRIAEARRNALLEERSRSEVLADHPGVALPYLLEASRAGGRDEALGFLIAEAIRSFDAQIARLQIEETTGRIAVSTDGTHIATSGGGEVKLWSADGLLQHELAPAPAIRAMAFDPTGTLVAAAGDDGALHVWTVDGKPRFAKGAHAGPVEDVVFSPDGTTLATAGDDHVARIWDATSGAKLAEVTDCHDDAVLSVRYSPDGSRIATASRDATACIVEISSGIVQKIRGHSKRVNSVRWSSDGLLVATASDDGTARIWSAARGKPVIKPLHAEQDAPMYVAEITSDRRVLTAGGDHLARVWQLPALDPAELLDNDSTHPRPEQPDPPDATLVRTLRGHADKIVAAVWSTDETRVATAGHDRRAIVWDPVDGQRVASFEHADVVGDLAFAVGNKRLVTASRDGTARIWDIDRASAQHWSVRIESEIHAIATSGDSLAIGTADARVRLWRSGHGLEGTVLPDGHESRVLAMDFTPEGGRLVTGGDDPDLFVWDVATGKHVATLHAGAAVRAIAVSPDGRSVAAAVDGTAMVWPTQGGEPRRLDAGGRRIDTVAFSSTGLLAGGGADLRLVLWDPRIGIAPRATLDQPGPVTALAFSRDGRTLAVAGQGDARIYPVTGAQLGTPLPIEGPVGSVRAIAFSRGGGLVITASDEGIAKIWDARKGKLLGMRDPHGSGLSALAISADGGRMWIASQDGTLGQWDLRVEDRPLAELAKFVDDNVAWVLTRGDVVERKGATP